MCGRYLLDLPGASLATVLGAVDRTAGFMPTWNAAPSQLLPVLGRNPETREQSVVMMEWGLVPSWAISTTSRPQINARAETIAERPMFRSAFARRRCLVPMRGWYEWVVRDGQKSPWLLEPACSDNDIPTAAGIWEAVRDESGSRRYSFAIITCEAAPAIHHLHHRQPVMVSAADREMWLDADGAEAQRLLRARDEPVAHWEVSRAVNNVRNNDSSLAAPVHAG